MPAKPYRPPPLGAIATGRNSAFNIPRNTQGQYPFEELAQFVANTALPGAPLATDRRGRPIEKPLSDTPTRGLLFPGQTFTAGRPLVAPSSRGPGFIAGAGPSLQPAGFNLALAHFTGAGNRKVSGTVDRGRFNQSHFGPRTQTRDERLASGSIRRQKLSPRGTTLG